MHLVWAQSPVDHKKRIDSVEEKLNNTEEKVNNLEASVKTRPDYFTIVDYASLTGVNANLKIASSLGRKAQALCVKRKIQTDEIPDPGFGRVILKGVFNGSIS